MLYPPINLFYHYVRNDRDGFAPALVDALKLHRTYWTLNEDRAKDVDGSIRPGPPRHRLPRLRRRVPSRRPIRLPPQAPPAANLARGVPHLIIRRRSTRPPPPFDYVRITEIEAAAFIESLAEELTGAS